MTLSHRISLRSPVAVIGLRLASWLIGLLVAASFGTVAMRADERAVDDPAFSSPTPDQIAFFEKRIRPVLVERCYQCHSEGADDLQAGLRLDDRDTLLRGGDSGPAIVPGDPGESLLIQSLRFEALEMPPDGQLSEQVIADFEQWVAMGAPDPRVGVSDVDSSPRGRAGEDHWAFQPISHSPPPSVVDQSWPLNDIDYFTLDRLERAALKPVADADRYAWLRRVSIDLTGLPPTVGEMEDFVADESPLAYERVVDRLLGSRAFGERWAQHWLDLVGYADQKGTQSPWFAANAWRYRDYVIDSLNRDQPFDDFIRQQLAGDLMPYDSIVQRKENLIATGYLVLGDFSLIESDKEKLHVDSLDQQVEKISKGFLGLTVACARCHDHKFDPIPRDDYYAIAGILHSTASIHRAGVGTWTDVNDVDLPETEGERIARLHRENEQGRKLAALVKEQRDGEARVAELDELLKEVDKLQGGRARSGGGRRPTAGSAASANREKPGGRPAAVELTEEQQALQAERTQLNTRLTSLDQELAHAELFVSQVPKAHGVCDIAEPTDMRITIRGNPRALGAPVPRGALSVLPNQMTAIPEGESGRAQLADWLASPDNPLTPRVTVNRIWQALMGAGLQRNVDYFGLPEGVPTHPELLDYLATMFLDSGWSRKSVVRAIALSRTYRMGSFHDEQAHQTDPDNLLLWRMNRRRLDAEALRDSLVAASGTLSHAAGGPALSLERPENVGNIGKRRVSVNPVQFRLTTFRPDQPFQRSIYLPVLRGTPQHRLAEARNVFDFTSPTVTQGQRDVTTVPTQALYLMNGLDVKEHAKRIAERLVAESDVPSERVEKLWLYVLARPVTGEEQEWARQFLSESGDDAWPELCHALIASNAFLIRI